MKLKNVSSETPVMIPGRMSGRSTSRRNAVFPGNSWRSSTKAPGTPITSAIATANSASLRLARADSSIPRSCVNATNHLRVPSWSGQAMIGESWNA